MEIAIYKKQVAHFGTRLGSVRHSFPIVINVFGLVEYLKIDIAIYQKLVDAQLVFKKVIFVFKRWNKISCFFSVHFAKRSCPGKRVILDISFQAIRVHFKLNRFGPGQLTGLDEEFQGMLVKSVMKKTFADISDLP